MAAPKSIDHILIIGATGLLGRAFMERLTGRAQYTVLVRAAGGPAGVNTIVGDVREVGAWQLALANIGVTHVVYLAGGRTGSLAELDAVHREGLRHVLQALQPRRPWVLFVSSGAVYGDQPSERLPITEESPPCPIGAYAESKWRAEQWLLAEAEAERAAGACVVRLANLIGPGLSSDFFPGKLIREIRARIGNPTLAGTPIQLGSLKASRDFIDVRDVASALHLLLNASTCGIFNIGLEQEVWLEEFVHLVQEIAGARFPITTAAERHVPTIRRQALATTAVRTTVGWVPHYTLQQSLRDMWHASAEA